MNYIAQIRYFWQLHEEHTFTPAEIALYFHLLEICNICRWKNPFKRNNAKICADLGISVDVLKRSRNNLQQHGLLTFESYCGKSESVYTLTNFSEATSELIHEVTPELIHEVAPEVAPAKDKLNETKQNRTNVCNVAPTRQTFTPPALEEVEAYCRKRGNDVNAEKFLDFYTSKGWMVGRNRMKDWRAAVRNWERTDNRPTPGKSKGTPHPAVNYQQQNFYDYDERWNE